MNIIGATTGRYTENRIYPLVSIDDFKNNLFVKIRKLVSNQKINHPWLEMNNFELMKSAGLYLKDYQSGKEGFTLASILLLGKDNVIFSILPHYKTDSILRIEDTDRYDDRDDIRTNLIDSYDRLMSFLAKHLNDKFYLEKDLRISLRDRIFREMVSNILIHREYLNPYPAKVIIEKDRVYAENSNKPHGNGIINPSNFSPYPKNPTIARFFKELGWVDELGSGVRNIHKYSNIYSGKEPMFIEEDIFKTIIPLSDHASDYASDHVSDHVAKITKKIIEFCKTPKSRQEIQNHIQIKHSHYFRTKYLNPLIKNGFLKMSLPDNPKNPNQKYYSNY